VPTRAGLCRSVPFSADTCRSGPVGADAGNGAGPVTVLVPAPGVGNGADRCRSLPRSLKARKKRCICKYMNFVRFNFFLYIILTEYNKIKIAGKFQISKPSIRSRKYVEHGAKKVSGIEPEAVAMLSCESDEDME
jgi:hypothetical protein